MKLNAYFCSLKLSFDREMINRELVRLKVVQLAYANYKNSGKSLDSAMKELTFSLSKTYDLYHYLLLLITNVTDYAEKRYDSLNERLKKIDSKEFPNPRFVKNRFALQLLDNKQLCKFEEDRKIHHWTEAEDIIRNLYKQITESDIYEEYMSSEDDSYNNDREFWRKIYKKIICNNDAIDSVLEEWSLYWNDDKEIIDTFVLKTIKRFEESNGSEQPLLPAYSSDEDKEFAEKLFESVLIHHEEYEDLIRKNTKNWDFSRIAVMDLIIMDCALAEIINFPTIEINVTLNEYINIAKIYSSPKSAGYVNGMLDHIVRNLKEENKLIK
jgi:N utilization substance protein B